MEKIKNFSEFVNDGILSEKTFEINERVKIRLTNSIPKSV